MNIVAYHRGTGACIVQKASAVAKEDGIYAPIGRRETECCLRCDLEE